MTAHDVSRALPGLARLRDLTRSLAVLDAILSPDWEYRYHSYTATWSSDEEAATMRNGSGDEYSIVFGPSGACIRGFAHESPMSPYVNDDPWPGVLDTLPAAFRSSVEDPAFTAEDIPLVTACLWRGTGDDRWHVGDIDYPESAPDPDGADHLFLLLTDPAPEAYRQFAEHYYETPVDLAAVRHVYELRPLTQDVVASLNPETSLDDLAKDLQNARYPRAT